jgi:ATP-dependent Clp protease protease subunit
MIIGATLGDYGKGLKLKNAAGDGKRLEFFGEVGNDDYWDGITPQSVSKALQDADGVPLEVWINSPGGSVFDGWAVYQQLRDYSWRHAPVTTHAAGLAASIASAIYLAGDRRTIGTGSHVMIHRPWAFTAGDAGDFRDLAEQLDRIETDLANAYTARTKITADEAREAMAAETWYDASLAVSTGFSTEQVDTPAIAACLSPRCKFRHPPKMRSYEEDLAEIRRVLDR